MAMAASRKDVASIGLDLERLVSAEIARQIQLHVASPTEVALCHEQALPHEVWMTLLFSAKESLYKALYPSVGRFFDFPDAEADRLDAGAGTLRLRLLSDLSPQCRAGTAYPIDFRFLEDRVLTCCVVSTLPAALINPSP